MRRKIEIIFADDHEFFRDGFRNFFEDIEDVICIGEASNGAELLQLTERYKPSVVLTDIQMPEINGIQATMIIKNKWPEIEVIALSMFGESDRIIQFLNAGGKGFLTKNATKDEVLEAIRQVNKGIEYFCSESARKALTRLMSDQTMKINQMNLLPIEIEVTKWICLGLCNKEIADSMNIKQRRVEWYRSNIMRKLNVSNSIGIIKYALKNGIIEL